jgi:hypothetical protein
MKNKPSLLLTVTQENHVDNYVNLCSVNFALNTEETTHRLFSSRRLHRAWNNKKHCNNYYRLCTIVKKTDLKTYSVVACYDTTTVNINGQIGINIHSQ